MQKCVIKYSEGEQQEVLEQDPEVKPNIPRTANEIHGFFQSKYLVLERSTFHISTKANLKYKITDPMYNNIIIG